MIYSFRNVRRHACAMVLLGMLGAGVVTAHAASSQVPGFTIADIRIQGIQRISAGTVFNLIPLSVGDRIDELGVRQLTRGLFASG